MNILEKGFFNFRALSAQELVDLQSGTKVAPGMPEKATDIAPVEMSLSDLINEFFELKARVNHLESRYNDLCSEEFSHKHRTDSDGR